MANLIDKAKNFLTEKVGAIAKPEAEISDMDLKDVDRKSATFLAKIKVWNPYSHSLPVCEISYSLKSGDRKIAWGKMEDPGSVAAEMTTMLEIPVNVAHGVLVSLARDIASDWDIDYDMEVGLAIDLPVIGNFTIPLSKKGELKLPTLSDFF